MGVGDWLASAAELDVALKEKEREEWEVNNYLEGEKEEMVQLYIKKGVPEKNARRVIEILSSNKEAFVEIMMAEELGIPADALEDQPWKHGLINFGSFTMFGLVPLIVFMAASGGGLNPTATFGVSIAVTLVTLVLMGIIQARLTGANYIKTTLTTVCLGSITAFIGWIVSFALTKGFPGVSIPM